MFFFFYIDVTTTSGCFVFFSIISPPRIKKIVICGEPLVVDPPAPKDVGKHLTTTRLLFVQQITAVSHFSTTYQFVFSLIIH